MVAQELRGKTVEQLKELLGQSQREQFKLRVQRATGELANPARFKVVGREIARIKTLIHEKSTQAES